MHTTGIGNNGETIAVEALLELGYNIIERNWKTKWAEVDIIAQKNKILFFIEVKYRQNKLQGDGLDYITDKKLQHMMRAAELWVLKHDWQNEYQLLAVAVSGIGNEVTIREII